MIATQAPATNLVLVRHGQSLYNRDGERAGLDSGLTALGWRQAQAVADWLAQAYRADLILASNLVRAQQTAEVIAARLNLPYALHAGLEEAAISYWDELPRTSDDPLGGWDNHWRPHPDISPIYTRFREQVHDSLRQLLARYAGQTVIVVAHGGVIGTILRGLFGGHYVSVVTENTGVTQMTWERNHWRLVFHNSTAHLADLMPPPVPSAPATPPRPSPWADEHQFRAIAKQFSRVAGAAPTEPVSPSEQELRELVQFAEPRRTDRVLDVGAGAGAVALTFAPWVDNVLGIDLAPGMLERAEAIRSARGVTNIHYRLGELGALSLAPGSFDIVTCHNLLHYVSRPGALFIRFAALLAPGGKLVLDELIGHDDPVKRATQNAIELRRDPALTRVPNATEIEQALAGAGFKVRRSQRYTVHRELDEWLALAAADDATRSAVRAMIEAGLEADSAGMAARYNRDDQITFTQSRLRLVAGLGAPAEQ